MDTKFEKLTFPGSMGTALAARLELPVGAPRAYALFAHCFTCTKDIFAAGRIAEALARKGIAVLRFDFTGLGASEGDFANTNFSSNVADLVKAADYLRENYRAPSLLIGHSLGGAAVLAAAGEVPEAVAVATIGAPSEPAHVANHFTGAIPDIEKAGEAEVLLAGRPFRVKKQFLDDIASQRLKQRIQRLSKALVIFHSPTDSIVGIDNARAIYEAARHPKSFISLDNADHLLSRRADAVYVADVMAAWAVRYIGETGSEAREATRLEPGVVLVEEAGPAAGRLAQTIRAGRHHLTADEPLEVGGADTGPNPYELLLAGLGACTSMTLRLYADHKKWPLERVRVRLAHEKIHARDCADCETRDGKIDRIERRIEVIGPLDESQRQRLIEIANKCPVHRTLESEIKIVTALEENSNRIGKP